MLKIQTGGCALTIWMGNSLIFVTSFHTLAAWGVRGISSLIFATDMGFTMYLHLVNPSLTLHCIHK